MFPLLVFVASLVCLGNLIGLALFIAAYRRQAARQRELLHQTRDDFQEAINQILDRYQTLRTRVDQAEEAGQAIGADQVEEAEPEFATIATMLPAIRPIGTGINFSKRAQILRLHRQGAGTSRIAEETGLPKAEVELVVKLHSAAAV